VVVSAVDRNTGARVAIKKCPNVFEDALDAKRIAREIRLLRHFHHPNIVKVRGGGRGGAAREEERERKRERGGERLWKWMGGLVVGWLSEGSWSVEGVSWSAYPQAFLSDDTTKTDYGPDGAGASGLCGRVHGEDSSFTFD
jgi:serine/threonine protein kinase